MKKIAIVGAGPSGVYCALHLQDFLPDTKIDIFEKNSPLKTLLPTGGGRCNLTHEGYDIKDFAKNYPRGEKFLYSLFSKHFVHDALEYFEKLGIKTYKQEDNRYFPQSNSAGDMRKKLLYALKSNIIKKNITDLKELDSYNAIVISCGSYGGYELARQAGHTIVEPKSALCGLKLSQNSPKYPQGVVLNTKEGEVLFTKNGISGPLIYKISSVNAYKDFPYIITLPFIDIQELTQKIKENPKKSIGNIVSQFIPKSLAQVILKDYNLQCANVKKTLIQSLENISFEVTSPDNKGEIVHAGGVDLSQLTNNCRSKYNPKIWFCGEIMNIDGLCGGYNLQNCWSSAYCAALDISRSI